MRVLCIVFKTMGAGKLSLTTGSEIWEMMPHMSKSYDELDLNT